MNAKRDVATLLNSPLKLVGGRMDEHISTTNPHTHSFILFPSHTLLNSFLKVVGRRTSGLLIHTVHSLKHHHIHPIMHTLSHTLAYTSSLTCTHSLPFCRHRLNVLHPHSSAQLHVTLSTPLSLPRGYVRIGRSIVR